MKRLLILFFTLLTLHAYSQVRFANLEQCLLHVKENNPGLKSEQLNLSISTEHIKSAWALLLPQIKAFGTFDNNVSLPVQLVPAQFLGGTEGEFAEVRFGTQYNTTYGAEASLSLINISNWKNVNAALMNEKAAQYQLKDRELGLLEQAATAYYFALLSREAVVLSKELVHASDSLLAAADVRLKNGLIEPMDYNRVKALYLETVQQLKANEGSYAKNLQALKALTAINDSDSLVLAETITQTLNQNTSSTQLTVESSSLPRYHALSCRKLQFEEELKRQRARILPELSLFARYSRQSFSNELDMFGSDSRWYEIGVAGLRAEWNLFTGFNRKSSIKQAALQSRIAEYDLENYTLQSDKELQELKINHQVALDGVNRFIEHYQLSVENFQIAGEKYNQGVYSIDQYITIYQERVHSQNQYLNSLANFLVYESIIRNRNRLQ